MQSFGGQNAHIITDASPVAIASQLNARGITAGHFNNGTFMLPKDKFAPAFLAAEKRVTDLRDPVDGPDVAIIVAINSDKSMRDSYLGKDNEAELNANLIPQTQRANDTVGLLSALFPNRPVAVIFYDEQTPHELYEGLSKEGFGMKSLHKVGYGTSADDKPIIGSEFFDWVYACPLPFDAKPVMHKDTRDAVATDRRPDVVEKLTEAVGPHGAPYITAQGKLLFPVPASLSQYAAAQGGPAPAPSAQP